MNKRQRALLYGMSIGDGHVFNKVDRRYPSSVSSGITMKHCARQVDYLEYKVNLLHSILGGNKPNIHNINNNGYPGVVSSKGHKYFRIVRRRLYHDGRKQITRQILNWLTPEAIAIWYMDDGGLAMKRRNGKIHARELMINTHISRDDNQIIIDYFNEIWGVRFGQAKNNGSYRLRCGTHEAKKFIEIVLPYIVPSMSYKVDMQYQKDTSAEHPLG